MNSSAENVPRHVGAKAVHRVGEASDAPNGAVSRSLWLVIEDGEESWTFEFTAGEERVVIVGALPVVDVRLSGPKMPPIAFHFEREQNGIVVAPTGAASVRVNAKRIIGREPVGHAALVELGNSSLKLKVTATRPNGPVLKIGHRTRALGQHAGSSSQTTAFEPTPMTTSSFAETTELRRLGDVTRGPPSLPANYAVVGAELGTSRTEDVAALPAGASSKAKSVLVTEILRVEAEPRPRPFPNQETEPVRVYQERHSANSGATSPPTLKPAALPAMVPVAPEKSVLVPRRTLRIGSPQPTQAESVLSAAIAAPAPLPSSARAAGLPVGAPAAALVAIAETSARAALPARDIPYTESAPEWASIRSPFNQETTSIDLAAVQVSLSANVRPSAAPETSGNLADGTAELRSTESDSPVPQRVRSPKFAPSSSVLPEVLEKVGAFAKRRPLLAALGTFASAAILALALVALSRLGGRESRSEPRSTQTSSAATLGASWVPAQDDPSMMVATAVAVGSTDVPVAAPPTAEVERAPAELAVPKTEEDAARLLATAVSHLASGRFSDAEATYTELGKISPNPEAYQAMARLLARKNGARCATGEQARSFSCPEIKR